MLRRGSNKKPRPKPPGRFRDRPLVGAVEGIAALGLIALFAWGAYAYARTAPALRVKTIRVEGTDKIDENRLVDASGVTNDDAMLFLDPKEVQDRIASLPSVKTCRVSRFFPEKVVIAIEERRALATLLVNNRLFEVDDEGNVLRELDAEKELVGPLVTNVSGLDYVEPGQRLDSPALMAALAVWRVFSGSHMAQDVTVSEISAAQESRICMYCDEVACEIRWGRDNFEKQARKLDVFWNDQNRTLPCKEYVDLRFGNDVACR